MDRTTKHKTGNNKSEHSIQNMHIQEENTMGEKTEYRFQHANLFRALQILLFILIFCIFFFNNKNIWTSLQSFFFPSQNQQGHQEKCR